MIFTRYWKGADSGMYFVAESHIKSPYINSVYGPLIGFSVCAYGYSVNRSYASMFGFIGFTGFS